MTTFKRTFVAVPVPRDERFLSLLRIAPRNFRPLHPLDLHITLAFLGDCDARQCSSVLQVLRANPPPPWKAKLGLPRRFGRRSAAIGYPLTGSTIFLRWLGQQHQRLFEAAGTKRDLRPIELHLTMAWQTGAGDTQDIESESWLNRLRTLSGHSVALHGIALYCRCNQPDERRYRRIADPLSSPAP